MKMYKHLHFLAMKGDMKLILFCPLALIQAFVCVLFSLHPIHPLSECLKEVWKGDTGLEGAEQKTEGGEGEDGKTHDAGEL